MKYGLPIIPGSPQYALDSVKILLAAQKELTLRSMIDVLLEIEWNFLAVHAGHYPPQLPPVILVQSAAEVWVGVSGTNDWRQAAAYSNPLALVNHDDDGHLCNFVFHRWGQRVVQWAQSLVGQLPPKVHFFGHSFGGAVALEASWWFARTVQPGRTSAVTVGSPKAGSKEHNAGLSREQLVRWRNVNDIVPALPPDPSQFAPLPFKLKALLGGVGLLYAQPVPAQTLLGEGVYEQRDDDLLVEPLLSVLADAATPGQEVAVFKAHLIDTYRDNLEGVVQKGLRSNPRPPGSKPPVVPPQIGNPAGGVDDGPLAPTVTYAVPFEGRFQAHKQKGQAVVRWFGRNVIDCPTISHARTVAKWANRWLRSQQSAVFLDGTALQTAFQAFLAAASLQAGGFVPVLPID